MHFLLITTRTEDPTLMISPEKEDPNFRLKEPSSAEKLLETWKKDQKHLELSEKEAKSTNAMQEYNQNRAHGLETLFKSKKTRLKDHGSLDAS